MTKLPAILKNTKIRFIGVGIANTAVDFIVFNIVLFSTGMPPALATIISTSVAMGVSYFLNRRIVFKAGGRAFSRQLVLFLAATILSQWVVQAIIISYMTGFLQGIAASLLADSAQQFWPQWLVVNFAKATAVAAGAITNYLLYSRIVFSDKLSGRSFKWPKK